MNLYTKIVEARNELQALKLKKSGQNKYSNFTYYELGDFLPAINQVCKKHNLMTRFNIIKTRKSELAILTIFNAEEPKEKVDFISPTAEVEIGRKKDGTGGAEPIQNLGGKITYMRRYMLMTAFEMVESEMVDSITRELSDDISEADKKEIRSAKTLDQLKKTCALMKAKYKISLITPIYEEMEQVINQEESQA